jgi:hypothetical protein
VGRGLYFGGVWEGVYTLEACGKGLILWRRVGRGFQCPAFSFHATLRTLPYLYTLHTTLALSPLAVPFASLTFHKIYIYIYIYINISGGEIYIYIYINISGGESGMTVYRAW